MSAIVVNSDTDFDFQISERALSHFAGLLAEQEDKVDLRISANDPGTANAKVDIEYCYEEDIQPTDHKLEAGAFDIYFPKAAVQFLNKAKIDFEDKGVEGSQLVITAPNLQKIAYPEDANLRDKVEYLFNLEINNVLAEHGGRIELVDVQGNDVYLRFSGGCKGCSMVSVTLKNGIEQTLRKYLPEITQIIDVTNHSEGQDPYYK